MLCFFDTETCGLAGPAVTIQYAFDEGPIEHWDCWYEPISETLSLIERMMECDVVGFNLAFDMFQINKLYNMLLLLQDKVGPDEEPKDHIDLLAELEPLARDGVCVKPRSACDLMCVARKTKYQSTMDRKNIVIRRVPTVLATRLAHLLERKIEFSDIYFARRKDKFAPKWKVKDIKGTNELKDVVLSFKASSSLKALAVDALKLTEVSQFSDIQVDKRLFPVEALWAPFAKSFTSKETGWEGTIKIGKKKVSGQSWPALIKYHLSHWRFNALARKYASNDVDYTRRLYHYFDRPEPGDDDSELACLVGAVRWKGYRLDVEKLQEQLRFAIKRSRSVPTSPRVARNYIYECLGETEKLVLAGSTKKVVLEQIAKYEPQKCFACGGAKCLVCDHTGIVKHPAAKRAKEVLDARSALKEIDLYQKLLMAGRFHASFNVIGTLSSRMSGADRLNAQGINKTKEVRSCFILAWGDDILCGGDFSGFEVVLADSVYNDPELRKQLLTCGECEGGMERVGKRVKVIEYLTPEAFKRYVPMRIRQEMAKEKKNKEEIAEAKAKGKDPPKPYVRKTKEQIIDASYENAFVCQYCGHNSGKKIHALFGVHVYPGMTYEEILASDGTKDDKYTRCKSAVFAMLYGGEGYTLRTRLGVDQETADKAYQRFVNQFRGVGKARQRVVSMFSALRQPGGIGSKIEWRQPSDSISSIFGFERRFTLENMIIQELFKLANNPPKEWHKINIKIQRRQDRIQTVAGALQSALYGAAFGIQSSNVRAAANHEIQSSGAQITKRVQRRIWDLQPCGIHRWLVQPCNVHDEILTPTHPDYVEKVKNVVNETVETFRDRVPLILMEWKSGLKTWADKK